MRIVGGSMRGRVLAAPRPGDLSIRPTSDRARESLFNILNHAWPHKLQGTRVADLFAGTGALGFEALSRGAANALFVETAAGSRGLIRTNIETFNLEGVARIFRRDATDLGLIGAMEPFDLVFADPPYGKGLGERALVSLQAGGWLRPDALVVLEEATNAAFAMPDGFVLADSRTMGETTIRFIELQG